MLTFISQRFTIFLLLFNLFTRLATADKSVRYMTSDGVVYSYAVVTSTLQPARVLLSTSTYTTVRQRKVTIVAGLPKVTATITPTSSLSSISTSETETTELNTVETDHNDDTPANTIPDVTSSVDSSVSTEIAEISSSSTTSSDDNHDDTTVIDTTSSSSSTTTTTTADATTDDTDTTTVPDHDTDATPSEPNDGGTEEQPSSPEVDTTTSPSITETPVQETGSIETPADHPEDADGIYGTISTETTTHSRTTLEPTPTSTPSETESINGVPITTGREGSICYVYYDDPNDEYYSTVYITDPAQTVDAATTLTSTMTRTITRIATRQA